MDLDVIDGDECECDGGGEWLATFADLSTLLLTFFVLLLSFSNMDVIEFREMLGSVRDAFGVQKQIQGPLEAIASSPVELSLDQNDGAGMAPPHRAQAALDEAQKATRSSFPGAGRGSKRFQIQRLDLDQTLGLRWLADRSPVRRLSPG